MNGLSSFEIEIDGGRKGVEGKFLIDEIKFTGFGDIFFLSLKDNLYGFPKKTRGARKLLHLSDKELIEKIARDTLKHFIYLIDKRTHLPVDWVELNPEFHYRIGDYTSPTNIGLYLMVLTMSEKLNFLKEAEVKGRIKDVLKILSSLPKYRGLFYNWYSTTNLKITSHYISTVDNGWLAAGLMVVEKAYPEIKTGGEILRGMDFSFLYDPVYGQFYLGYFADKKKFSPYHYELIETEPRVTSFIAIGKGDVPISHWFRIYRTLPKAWKWQRQIPEGLLMSYFGVDVFEGYYRYDGMKIVPSWGGSSFEFLMPLLVMKEIELAPYGLGLNDRIAAEIHYIYGIKKKKYKVWGLSPCFIPGKDEYGEFGVSEIGTKGYPDKGIITPYASILAIEIIPEKVIKNVRNFLKYYPEIYGEYGFFDAVDVKNKKVATRYLTLDQAMIFLSIANYLTEGYLRKLFHSHPYSKNAEKVLIVEKFFPVEKKIKPEKFLIFCDFNSGKRKLKNLEFGTWNINPKEENQQIIDRFVLKDRKRKGYALQIYYRIKEGPVGFWMKFKNLEINNYRYLGFWIKGDKKKGYTKSLKIEIEKENGETGYYFISNIGNKWKMEIIPFSEIMGFSEIEKIKKLNFVFDSSILTEKEGIIYLDDIFIAK